MKITNVTATPLNITPSQCKAKVSIILNDCLRLTNMILYEGVNGLFVTYPSSSEFPQFFYPLTKAFREYVEEVVIAEYHKQVGN